MSTLFVLAAAALSSPQADAEFESCVQAITSYSDRDYGRCYEARYQRADERLNARWQQLMALVTDDRFDEDAADMRSALIAAQRNWIEFKETACNFYLLGYQGTIATFMNEPACRVEIVEHRISEIEGMITTLDAEYYEGQKSF